MSKNVLIITPTLLKERSAIHTNVDEKLIFPEIKAAQDLYILPLLGSNLFNKIIADIDGGTLVGNYKILVDDYLIDTLINYTLRELPEGLNYQFWNTGLTTTQKEGESKPSMSEMYATMNRYGKRAEAYAERTMKYLIQNEGLYPEYRQSTGGVDRIYPANNTFVSPIYLGDGYFEKPNKSYNDPWI